MTKKRRTGFTGKITRSFLKHKIYGTVYAVDIDESGEVLAAAAVSAATACRHQKDFDLSPDEAGDINANLRDFEPFDIGCSDATHLLAEIGEQEQTCQAAEVAWVTAHSRAKALKEELEQQQTRLRTLVREATTPTPLPRAELTLA